MPAVTAFRCATPGRFGFSNFWSGDEFFLRHLHDPGSHCLFVFANLVDQIHMKRAQVVSEIAERNAFAAEAAANDCRPVDLCRMEHVGSDVTFRMGRYVIRVVSWCELITASVAGYRLRLLLIGLWRLRFFDIVVISLTSRSCVRSLCTFRTPTPFSGSSTCCKCTKPIDLQK